jgi:hypothetical protein
MISGWCCLIRTHFWACTETVVAAAKAVPNFSIAQSMPVSVFAGIERAFARCLDSAGSSYNSPRTGMQV